jgi:hypothetical protein
MTRSITDAIKFIAEDRQTDLLAFKTDMLALCFEIQENHDVRK